MAVEEQFLERISDDWLWRERELRQIDALMLARKSQSQAILIKSAVLLHYAHWEGLFKLCSAELLEFIQFGVKRKIFDWTDVKAEVRHRLLFCIYRRSSLAQQKHEVFISHLNALTDKRFGDITAARDEIIMIDDNLSSLRAEAICRNLGVGSDWFLSRRVIIDERMLEHRNAIAHGSARLRTGDMMNFDDGLLVSSLGEMRDLVRMTKDQFQNAIVLRTFLESKQPG